VLATSYWVGARLTRALRHQAGVPSQALEFHGQNDLDAIVPNAVSAWLYGAAANNGTLLGIGERSGNSAGADDETPDERHQRRGKTSTRKRHERADYHPSLASPSQGEVRPRPSGRRLEGEAQAAKGGGGPPIPGTSQPAGATDILISYTVRLAFTGGQGGRGVDYGFAAAISVFIFLIIAGITMINFRFSRQLEQVSENL